MSAITWVEIDGVRHSILPELGLHVGKLIAERDALKALNAELVEALRSITSGIADHLKAGTVRCDSCASEVENARSVLAKVSK